MIVFITDEYQYIRDLHQLHRCLSSTRTQDGTHMDDRHYNPVEVENVGASTDASSGPPVQGLCRWWHMRGIPDWVRLQERL